MSGLHDAFERIGEAAELQLPLTHAPGLALAVTDGDDTLGAVVRGFADVAGSRPVRPDTRFQIGSISKSFAALCLLQEEAKGTLALDVSVNELVPWLDLPEPFAPITLHHLLTHTSGLMMGVEHGPWGIADLVRANETPPTFAPGQRFHYSNLGYKIVGQVLERTTGTPIHVLLLERVLGPLGMTDSFGAITEELRQVAAVGYEPLLSDRPAHLNHPLGPAVWQPSNSADGSIVSTVTDMCAYARLVLHRGRGPEDVLLEEGLFDRWIGPYVDSDERGARYGYGWDVLEYEGRRVIQHSGGTVGFNALLQIWPDDGLAVMVCINGHGVRDHVTRYALEVVGASLRGDDLPPVPIPAASDAVDEADGYGGTYRSEQRTIDLDPQDGGLVLRAGPLAVRLERFGEEADTFAVPHPALDRHLLRIVRDATGAVVGATHGPTVFARDGAPVDERATTLDLPSEVGSFPGLYRSDGPWLHTFRVYLRDGRPVLAEPASGEEYELTPADDGWWALGDPALPRRVRFRDVVEGSAQTLDYEGAVLTRSFED
jgi:D-alanyl-D-alanine carboxypeptidase